MKEAGKNRYRGIRYHRAVESDRGYGEIRAGDVTSCTYAPQAVENPRRHACTQHGCDRKRDVRGARGARTYRDVHSLIPGGQTLRNSVYIRHALIVHSKRIVDDLRAIMDEYVFGGKDKPWCRSDLNLSCARYE